MTQSRRPRTTDSPPPDSARASRATATARRQSRSLTVDGNRLTLLTDGPERLETLLALIEGAQSSLRILYYIFSDDRSGALVRDALLRAVDRGVAVSLLIDGFGSSKLPDDYFRELRDK